MQPLGEIVDNAMKTLQVTPKISDLAIAGGNTLAARDAERQRAENERDAKAQAKRDKEWEPIVNAVKDATPVWAHDFIRWDASQSIGESDLYGFNYRPVEIRLPGCAKIEAYHTGETGSVAAFRVIVPEIYRDYEGEYVIRDWDGMPNKSNIRNMETDFEVAVYLAYSHGAELDNLREECNRLNRQAEEERAEPATPGSLEIMQKYARPLAELEAAETNLRADWGNAHAMVSAALMWAAIAQAEALQRIASALESRY